MFVLGDFNFNALSSERNLILRELENLNFRKIVEFPTHILGGLIDHCYLSDNISPESVYFLQKSVYYTDHDVEQLNNYQSILISEINFKLKTLLTKSFYTFTLLAFKANLERSHFLKLKKELNILFILMFLGFKTPSQTEEDDLILPFNSLLMSHLLKTSCQTVRLHDTAF